MYGRNPYGAPQQPRFVPDLFGPLELLAAPCGAIVDVNRASTQCRVDQGTEDDWMNDLIQDAQDYIENTIPGHRQLLTASYNLPMRAWWGARNSGYGWGWGIGGWGIGSTDPRDDLYLPRPPLQAVTGITYYDTFGNLQTLDPSLYIVRTPFRRPGVVQWAPLVQWPALQCGRTYPVAVQFTCGYGVPPAPALPRVLIQAALMLIQHWYDRGEADGQPLEAVDRLIGLYQWGSYK